VDGWKGVGVVSEQRDGESLGGFAAMHQVGLTRFVYLLAGDRYLAEDLVQDVLTAMFRRFGDSLPIENPVAYARAAAVNTWVSRRRLRSSTRERSAGLRPGDHVTTTLPDLAERDVVWRALARLSRRQRAVLVLRFYADLTDRDIAAILGCRIGTVSSLAARALAALRKDADLADKSHEETS
jgi:RNA polymerase sigma-70 factor (sigma-E family)